VPDSTLSGLFLESPYIRMMENLQRGEPLYITIGEHRFEIPFKHWWLYPNEKPCIQSGLHVFTCVCMCLHVCLHVFLCVTRLKTCGYMRFTHVDACLHVLTHVLHV